jgi:polyisoprenyl-teichoic acid--peptidoglycan teichoic acid transferase
MNNQNLHPTRNSIHRWIPQAFLLFAILAISSIAGVISYAVIHQLTVNNVRGNGSDEPTFSSSQMATQAASGNSLVNPSNPGAPAIEPTLTPWDGVGRVTILLLGLDYRDWEAGSEYSRSDTMIILTLDPLSKTAGILSIPRDMWVAIPGFQHEKINTAYFLGDAYKLPGGGPGLAVKTVEQFLGVPINYYAQIDFGAFVKFIDELGGVKINVPEPITIDLLGAGSATKKKLQPGVQILPGEWALAYARNRYTPGGDFDRARRQQQVIMAIRDRVLSLNMLPTLIAKANILYQQLASGVHTNLTLDQVGKLALLASQVPDQNIKRGVIDQSYILYGRSPDNLSILIPLPDKIRVLRDDIFADTTALGPLTPGDALARMQAENARVSIQDGTGAQDLSERTAQYLQTQGVNVIEATGAAESAALTTIIDHTGKPFTSRFLVDLMGVSPQKIVYDYNPGAHADIEIILGDDWANKNALR